MLKSALLLTFAFSALLVACSATPTPTTPPPPPPIHTLTVAVSPLDSGGTVEQDPPPDPGGRYSPGTAVKLTASPAGQAECSPQPYWSFAGWSGDVQGSAPTAQFTMDSDKRVTAEFKEFFPPQCPTQPPPCDGPTLEISVNSDALEFDRDELQVAAGTEAVLCFSNRSSFSQHNWVLVQDGTKDAVAQRGSEHPDNGWVQPDDPDVVARTKLLNPGESGEVSFTRAPIGRLSVRLHLSGPQLCHVR